MSSSVKARKRINSRDKGRRGEREAARYLTSLGFKCERNCRNGVSAGDFYGLSRSLPMLHIECKFGVRGMDIHTTSLRAAMDQAFSATEAGGERPAVLWRPLRAPWRLTWEEPIGMVTTTGDRAIRGKLLELNEKHRIGNSVPLPMGRAIAKAARESMANT